MATPNIRVQFGQRIRHLREKRGWRQDDLAAHANITRAHLSRLENAKKEVGLQTIQKLARALGLTPSQLLKGIR